MRYLVVLFLTASCMAQSTVTLPAIETTGRYYPQFSGYWWSSDYQGGITYVYCADQGRLLQGTGFAKFNISQLPESAQLISCSLSASIFEIRHDRPHVHAAPNISIYHVEYDDWVREGNTWIAYQEQLNPGEGIATTWELTQFDFIKDVADNFISLAFHNETIPVCDSGEAIANYVLYYGSDTDLRPYLTLVYCDGCSADLNQDLLVDITDLSTILAHFGSCSQDPDFYEPADLDGRGCVGLEDLSILLTSFGSNCCP